MELRDLHLLLGEGGIQVLLELQIVSFWRVHLPFIQLAEQFENYRSYWPLQAFAANPIVK